MLSSPLFKGYIALVHVLDRDTMGQINLRELKSSLFCCQTDKVDDCMDFERDESLALQVKRGERELRQQRKWKHAFMHLLAIVRKGYLDYNQEYNYRLPDYD